MKQLLSIILAPALLSVSAMAQSASQGTVSSGNGAPQTVPAQSMEGIMKHGAQVVMVQGGRMTPLGKAVTLPNGMRVDPDGTITRPDRTQTTLLPTQMVTMAGMIVPLPAGTSNGGATTGDHSQATTTGSNAAPIKAGDGTGTK